ncbi:MAG: hypothetical protein MUF71_03090 [Candidatus Kapabacteria bacterium]|jgi:hypothetical protein|nr:hypothetical protein [Candidatus Kapabacteria bacterium]
MQYRIVGRIVLVVLGITFASLRLAAQEAQEDSAKTKFLWIWQTMGKVQPTPVNTGLGDYFQRTLNIPSRAASFPSESFAVSPFNLMLTYEKLVLFCGYSANLGLLQPFGFYSTAGRVVNVSNYGVNRTYHELTFGIGYAVINTPRFRLYPNVAFTSTLDHFMLRYAPTRDSMYTAPHPAPIAVELYGHLLEFALGADYRLPLAYFDMYIMAKVGFNFDPALALVNSPNYPERGAWVSRRGIFFQLGIGLGTERR